MRWYSYFPGMWSLILLQDCGAINLVFSKVILQQDLLQRQEMGILLIHVAETPQEYSVQHLVVLQLQSVAVVELVAN